MRMAIWRRPQEGFCCAVVWICPLALDAFPDVLIWDHKGPQLAKGHFKDCEVGAHWFVLLIVLCLWEERGVYASFVAKAFALFWGG